MRDRQAVPTLAEAALRLARASALISGYCDHAEHLEAAAREDIVRAGAELRTLAVELAAANSINLVEVYRHRLESVERRHPLYPAGGFNAADQIPDQPTWHLLQVVQWNHDRNYHPDVFGLSRYEQLRHYAFHLAKLASAGAEAAGGYAGALFEVRFPDVLLFGLKLATLVNESLPDDPVHLPARSE
jgi:hypothetical protein